MGVGRPDSTDPEVVAAYVLSRFAEPEADVRDLMSPRGRRSGTPDREIAAEEADPIGQVID